MFTAAEFRLIRARCPEKLDTLLQQLHLPPLSAEDDGASKRYSELDDKITAKLSQRMGNESVFGGYIDLLNLGAVAFQNNESDNALLEKIVANQAAIRDGIVRRQQALKNKPMKKKVSSSFDFSHVPCQIRTKNFSLRTSLLISYNRPLGPSNELAVRVRDDICHYWCEHRDAIIKSIDIFLAYDTLPKLRTAAKGKRRPLERHPVTAPLRPATTSATSDCSDVACQIRTKKFSLGTILSISYSRPLEHSNELGVRIRDDICRYWREHRAGNIKSIDIVLGYSTLLAPQAAAKSRAHPPTVNPIEAPLPLDSIAEVLPILSLIHDIIKVIEA